jgi:hypothetical protein
MRMPEQKKKTMMMMMMMMMTMKMPKAQRVHSLQSASRRKTPWIPLKL